MSEASITQIVNKGWRAWGYPERPLSHI